MITQSTLTVVAPVGREAVGPLRTLLNSMNALPGQANPADSLVPFGSFDTLHFARFVLLDDTTLDDVRLYNLARRDLPVYLGFFCDFDGGTAPFLDELVQKAASGLVRIFSHCEDYSSGTDLRSWMRDHDLPVAANYVNWVGRTVAQTRQEAALRRAIRGWLNSNRAEIEGRSTEQIRQMIRAFIRMENAEGRLALAPMEPASATQKLANLLHLIGTGLLIGLTLPVILGIVLFRVHPAESTDPVYAPRPDDEHARDLAEIEDYDVTNQFSAMGSVKPGLLRTWFVRFVLWVINFTARHIYTKGRLARVRTIHFARWVFLDGRRRIYFASNYDGSLESYMDDFINKVYFGLNVVFCNGIGYPTTNWVLGGGARDEQHFKFYLRRHQMPTQVWYNAHRGTSAVELERNGLIRTGLEAEMLTEAEAREWVQLL